jgi:hypothetical protein
MGDCAFWPAVFCFIQIFITCVFLSRSHLAFIMETDTGRIFCDLDFHVGLLTTPLFYRKYIHTILYLMYVSEKE